MSRPRLVVVLLTLAAAVVGCGGDGKSTASTSTSSTTSPDVTSAASVVPTTVTVAPTTTATPLPVYPLTGLPVTDAAVAQRPALVVKIDNNAAARPQSGLNEADIVFEEIIEVQTRFAAVFQSQAADPVGPIRSGRTQDILLLGSFNQPLFLWSGGNRNVTRAIEDSDFVDLSSQRNSVYQAAGFYRANDRKKPHDLYASATAAWTLAPEGAGPPPQQFMYLAPGVTPVGEPAAGVDLEMDGLPIEWRFDAASGSYLRSNGGTAHNDALSGQVSTNNVIIMYVDYQPSVADARSPEAQTIGSGEVLVFSGGVVQRGTWTRDDRVSVIVLQDMAGQTISLIPGRTFVELARVGTATPVA